MEYPYDTNYGLYKFKGNKMEKVFVPVEDKGEVIGKLECDIGGICIQRKIDIEEPNGYYVKNSVLMAKYETKDDTPVKPPIQPGRYSDPKNKKFYDCNKIGICEELDQNDNTIEAKIDDDGVIKVKIEDLGEVKGSKMHHKHLLKKAKKFARRDEEETESYEEVIELTHVSYTTSEENRNIFFVYRDDGNEDENYMMITNEDENKYPIGGGYSCYQGRCKEIAKNGNIRYYLNTAQVSNGENGRNELVQCGCENNECKCKFVPVTETTMTYENAASRSEEDAIISCNNKSGCQTVAVTADIGLPKCKANDKGDKPVMPYKTENGGILSSNQYCIFNNIIYGEGSSEIKEGINMFDVTSRLVSHESVAESHVYSSLYNCKIINDDKKCSQTYGYIVNNDIGYSVCSSTGCEYKLASDLKVTDCKIAGNAGIIKEGNLKLCLDGSGKTMDDAENKYYDLDINVNGSFPETTFGNKLLIGIKDKVAFSVIEDGYILLSKGNAVLKSNDVNGVEVDKTNILYECVSETKNCIPVKNEVSSYGYYKSPYSKNSIMCNSSGCGIHTTEEQFNEDNTKPEVYENYDSNKFVGLPYSVIAKSSQLKKVLLLANDYILLYISI